MNKNVRLLLLLSFAVSVMYSTFLKANEDVVGLVDSAEPILFSAGPVYDNYNKHYDYDVPLVTVKIFLDSYPAERQVSIAQQLSAILKKPEFENKFLVLQYLDEDFLVEDDWLTVVTPDDAWYIVADNTLLPRNAYLAEAFAETIIDCVNSIASEDTDRAYLGRLLQYFSLDSEEEVALAERASLRALRAFNSEEGCLANNNNQSLDLPSVINSVSYHLTDRTVYDDIVGGITYFQQIPIFQNVLFSNTENIIGLWSDTKLNELVALIESIMGRFIDIENLTQLRNPENYESFIDFIVYAKSLNSYIDDELIKVVAATCLEDTIDSVFKKGFSLAACEDETSLQPVEFIFRDTSYFSFTN